MGATVAFAVSSVTPEEHQRPPDQTYLTFPEWFLVYSPAEYAAFVKDRPPSNFPFFGHIQQFWQAYGAVYNTIKDKYAFNTGYHVMAMVIGTSTTVEYALRSAYETLFGRLAELTRQHGMTEEDIYAAKIAQDYVDFIRISPWYEYDFTEKLEKLWTETSLWGDDPARKWERKYALTSEYGVKALYGWAIKKATKASYDAPRLVTTMLVDRLPQEDKKQLQDLHVLERFPDQSALITVPRYDAFKDYAATLAMQDVGFIEIAGNRSEIVTSVLVPTQWEPSNKAYTILFIQPILTQPGTKRVVFSTSVKDLSAALRALHKPELQLEHVYDY